MKRVLAVICCMTFLSLNASADLLIEPQFNVSLSGETGSTDNEVIGTGFGGRLGLQSLGLMFGIDYQAMAETLDNAANSDVDTTEIGAFIGYNLPVMFRFYAAYLLSGEIEVGGTTYEGPSGYKLGIGWTGLPFMSVNIEYKDYEFDETEAGTTLANPVDYSSLVLALSIPFTF